jgi:hypothetical protein
VVELKMTEREIKRMIRAMITHGNVTVIKEQHVLLHEWLTHAHYKDEMSTTSDAKNKCSVSNEDCKVQGCPHRGVHFKSLDCAVQCPALPRDKDGNPAIVGGCRDYPEDLTDDLNVPDNNS